MRNVVANAYPATKSAFLYDVSRFTVSASFSHVLCTIKERLTIRGKARLNIPLRDGPAVVIFLTRDCGSH